MEALVQRWTAEGLSAGTIKNRMAELRWWAERSASRTCWREPTTTTASRNGAS
ncbi:MAG: phage integrase N-terminal domain-containing protein [Burkholderiales bacterium]